MGTAFLIGLIEITVAPTLSNDKVVWSYGYSPYERPAYVGRIERNIYTQTAFGIDVSKCFKDEITAINHIRHILNSIKKDYGVEYIEDNSVYIRSSLTFRLLAKKGQ